MDYGKGNRVLFRNDLMVFVDNSQESTSTIKFFCLFVLNESCNVYFRFSLGFFGGFLHFFFLFCNTGSMWEFLGQGLNLCHKAATRATVMRTQEPQPSRPSENLLNHNILELMRKYSKVSGQKINILHSYIYIQ